MCVRRCVVCVYLRTRLYIYSVRVSDHLLTQLSKNSQPLSTLHLDPEKQRTEITRNSQAHARFSEKARDGGRALVDK